MNAKPSDRNVGSGELDENLAEFLRTRVSEESINPKVKRKRVHEISEKPTNLPVTKRSEQPLSNAKRSTGAIISSDCMLMTVGDSDFYDFDNDRMEECFKKSQIWAVYDDDDGMPRHYALIEEVTSIDPFVVQISWLDIEINGDLSLILWEKSGYHTACGLFRTVRKATIESVNVFSHLISGERAMREIYRIYPMQGSIWALYRDLDSRKEDHLRGESQRAYDIVVSLTSFSEDYGISVAYLERVKGFKAVFKRSETGAHAVRLIEKDEVRQFSHQVPARTLSGTEDPYLPGECWELDPASLPSVGLVSS
ncbi:hypothetical protein AMTR_s00048p00106110 [Amborella trichopoda]|uniref:DUF3444 domain-containing protein n=2 Tax=Amborella trichopoda TaxID=13333 RepID=U5D5C7_AMBTC|nr:hypothetical protein AMTR_s00048p00106110 [Amborella trichopoda]